MSDSQDSGAQPPGITYRSPAGRWVLAAMVLGTGMASLDVTVVGIALPAIGRNFHVGVGTLQWVATGTRSPWPRSFCSARFLGDRFGRRKVFSIGVVWFAAASAAAGIVPSAPALIVARAIQGVGGALLTPGSLAILQASFAPADRSRAIGAWSGLGGITAAAGPLVGGYLISIGSWRWVFYLNLPVAAAVLAITARHVPESRDPTASHHTDLPGTALAVIALTGLTYALIEGPDSGWSSTAVLVMLVVAAVGLPAFVIVEERSRAPMLPMSLFRNRQFSATNGVTFAIYGALGGALFLLPVELQVVSGYSALESGLALLPLTIIMLILSARSGRLAARIGPRLQMSAGPIGVALGLALLTRAADHGSYVTNVLPAVMVFGLGLAATVAPLTSTAMDSAAAEHAGLASAVNNDVARAAGLLSVAILPFLAGITGSSYLHPHELASEFKSAVVMCAVVCAAGGALAAATIRNPPRQAAAPASDQLRGQFNCALAGPPLAAQTVPAGGPDAPAAAS